DQTPAGDGAGGGAALAGGAGEGHGRVVLGPVAAGGRGNGAGCAAALGGGQLFHRRAGAGARPRRGSASGQAVFGRVCSPGETRGRGPESRRMTDDPPKPDAPPAAAPPEASPETPEGDAESVEAIREAVAKLSRVRARAQAEMAAAPPEPA